jgi:glycerol-3-phosphate dehydrogenase
LIPKAKVTKLLEKAGEVVGVEYTTRDGKTHEEFGNVIIASGGYGADFSKDSLLS